MSVRTATRRIAKWLNGWLSGKPHVVVGDPADPYMLRWHVLPRNPWFNIYLHKFLKSDDDRALHDHPWPSLSVLLKGRYWEHTPTTYYPRINATFRKQYRAGSIIYRHAEYTHRIELIDNKPTWTLFITGPKVREWGFHCPKGWKHWRDYVNLGNHGEVGPGCGD